MKGLLLKDASTMIKETRYFFLLAVIVALLQNDFLFAYIIVYAATLPMAAIAYDERAKWKRMEETLPLKKTQMIGSKYVMGYICIAVAILLVLCGRLVGVVINGTLVPLNTDSLFLMLSVSCVALTVQALNLPLMFWIGVERGRLLFILIIVCSALTLASILEDVAEKAILPDMMHMFLIALAVAVAANLISFQVSKALYRREK